MHHSFNVLVLNILLHVSAFQNAVIRESDINMLRWCPMSWEAEKDRASFNVLVLNILLHVSAFQNAIIRESDMNMLRWCPMS
jgi:tRNA threonylcarbamoyladenosine modification (KEOPS) complex  Pcc1 subunit